MAEDGRKRRLSKQERKSLNKPSGDTAEAVALGNGDAAPLGNGKMGKRGTAAADCAAATVATPEAYAQGPIQPSTKRALKRQRQEATATAAATSGEAFEAGVGGEASGGAKKSRKRLLKDAAAAAGQNSKTLAGVGIGTQCQGQPLSKKALKRQRQEATAAAAASAAAAGDTPTSKKARKRASVAAAVAASSVGAATSAESFSKEVQRILRDLSDPSSAGSLSDRLNPTHSCYDKKLKTSWKSYSKKERTAIVVRDQARLQVASSATAAIEHPFPVSADDHCETASEAYRDVAPMLRRVAELLGKTPAELRIYDPYYCAGAMVKHLGDLGFESVYNKCEDFYAVVKEGRVPAHDVVVTNPPYSGDHVDRLLRWCRSNGKPFLLLMPNYFCTKDYYEPALGGASRANAMLYLYPHKRYMYWTPKGLRDRAKVQSQHSGAGGNRTSPFVSFWYLDLAPLVAAPALLEWWSEWWDETSEVAEGNTLCHLGDLPHGVYP